MLDRDRRDSRRGFHRVRPDLRLLDGDHRFRFIQAVHSAKHHPFGPDLYVQLHAGSPPDSTESGSRESESTATRTDDTSAGITLASGVTLEELKEDMESAQEIVDGYWVKHWSAFYTGSYESPTVLGLYDGTVADETPTCDGKPLESYNASYCSPEDFVAWDVNLMVRGADLIGDTWVYLVIAHEWGHAIQERLDPSLVAEGDELQADCLGAAGATDTPTSEALQTG